MPDGGQVGVDVGALPHGTQLTRLQGSLLRNLPKPWHKKPKISSTRSLESAPGAKVFLAEPGVGRLMQLRLLRLRYRSSRLKNNIPVVPIKVTHTKI